jgi:FKBP-type peptidyl-prolyl cis-trans isomerase (trigger factor)
MKTDKKSGQLIISFEVDKKKLQEEVEQILQKQIKNKEIKIKGFRAEDISLSLAYEEKGKELEFQILEEKINIVVAARAEKENFQVAQTKIISVHNNREDNYKFLVIIAPVPQIDLNFLKNCQIKYPVIKIEQNDIDEKIYRLRLKNASWEESTNPVAKYDKVFFNILQTNLPGLYHLYLQNIYIINGIGDFFFPFEEQLISKEKHKEYKIDLSEGYYIIFLITSIYRSTPTELNDQLFKDNQISNNIEQGLQLIKNDLENEVQILCHQFILEQISTKVVEFLPSVSPLLLKDIQNKTPQQIQSDENKIKLNYLLQQLRNTKINLENNVIDIDMLKKLGYISDPKDAQQGHEIFLCFQWIIENINLEKQEFSLKDFITAQQLSKISNRLDSHN